MVHKREFTTAEERNIAMNAMLSLGYVILKVYGDGTKDNPLTVEYKVTEMK